MRAIKKNEVLDHDISKFSVLVRNIDRNYSGTDARQ